MEWLQIARKLGIAIMAIMTLLPLDNGPTGQNTASQAYIRKDLVTAPGLNIQYANPLSYNCYGNALQKRIIADPTGYTRGDSTQDTFAAIQNDIGHDNIRLLKSISEPVSADEYIVALKCGNDDYHLVRCENGQWYSKSGTLEGVYWSDHELLAAQWHIGSLVYDDETLFFAIQSDWDHSSSLKQ